MSKAFWMGFWCGLNPLVSVAWLLYALGDLSCKALNVRGESEGWVSFWYPVYNRLMLCSLSVQGRSKCGPWGEKHQ